MTKDPSHTLARMEAMLRHCQRRILFAEVVAGLRNGLRSSLTGLLAVAAIFLLLRLSAHFLGTTAISGMMFLAMAVLVAVVICGRAILLVVRAHSPGFPLAAERIDLSQATHNRIATSISLLRAGDVSPFATAAIEEGFSCLEKLQREKPHFESATPDWQRNGALLGATLALALIGYFFKSLPLAPDALEPRIARLTPQGLKNLTPADTEPTTTTAPVPVTAPRSAPPTTAAPLAKKDETKDSPRGTRPEPGRDSRSDGPLGQHASGESRTGNSASDSRSPASGAGAKSDPSAAPNKPTKPRESTAQTAGQPKVDQENKKSGSINAQGSSGSSSMRSTQNEWSSEVTAKSNDGDDFAQEEEPDEEIDPDKQRLGMQPSLKNRNSAGSRELSLSMGNGSSKEMITGRGGPNADKKSRGTATMVMGVPVPGFVKGRLLPGPSKSPQEEVDPTPRPADRDAPATLEISRPHEATQERFRPDADLSNRARDYLLNAHATNPNHATDNKSHE